MLVRGTGIESVTACQTARTLSPNLLSPNLCGDVDIGRLGRPYLSGQAARTPAAHSMTRFERRAAAMSRSAESTASRSRIEAAAGVTTVSQVIQNSPAIPLWTGLDCNGSLWREIASEAACSGSKRWHPADGCGHRQTGRSCHSSRRRPMRHPNTSWGSRRHHVGAQWAWYRARPA
jgi:hypothetical protein